MRALQLTDPAEDGVWDENDAYWRSRNPEQRLRMEKGLKSLVLIAPTQHQLGQAQAVPDEHRTGVWEITRFSGAVERERRTQLVERAEALKAAVKQARERANRHRPILSTSARASSASCWASLGAGPRTSAGPESHRAEPPPGSCPGHDEAGRSCHPALPGPPQ
jgi:hypothetical protein